MILPCVGLPILCNLFLGSLLLLQLGWAERRNILHKVTTITLIEILSMEALYYTVRLLQGGDENPFPLIPVTVTLLLVSAAVLLTNRKETTRKKTFLRTCGCIAGTVFLLEIFVFHANSFALDHKPVSVSTHEMNISDAEKAVLENDMIRINENCTISWKETYSADYQYVRLYLTGEDAMYRVYVDMKDGDLTGRFEPAGVMQGAEDVPYLDFRLNPYESVYGVQVRFENVGSSVFLTGAELRKALPFSFSTARYFLILLIAVGLTFCKHFSIWNVRYHAKSWKHNLAILTLLLGCMATVLAFLVPEQELLALNATDANDPYALTAHAWLEGQIHLLEEPSPELLQMKNPYDATARDGVFYHWDYAFYNGKYYSYFGCTPVLLLYLPIYWLTGKLPTLNIAYCIVAPFVMLTLFGCIVTMARRYCKRPPLLLLLMGLLSATAACGIWVALNFSNRYSLCVLFGMAFLFLSLWTGYAATMAKRSWSRFLLLICSGVSVALAAASRPNVVLFALLLVPVFLELLLRKNLRLWNRVTSAACFLLPAIAGAGAIMWYNWVRFDDPLQFGAIYQMTVNNIAANQLSLSRFPAALATYVFNPPAVSGEFPYLRTSFFSLRNPTRYTYVDGSIGMAYLPSIALGFLSVPLVYRHWKQKKDRRVRCAALWIGVVTTLLLIWMDYCMAGVTLRYLMDILSGFAVLSTILLLQVPVVLKRYHAGLALVSQKVIFFAMAGTILVMFCLLIPFEESFNLLKVHPSLWNQLEEIVVFWR